MVEEAPAPPEEGGTIILDMPHEIIWGRQFEDDEIEILDIRDVDEDKVHAARRNAARRRAVAPQRRNAAAPCAAGPAMLLQWHAVWRLQPRAGASRVPTCAIGPHNAGGNGSSRRRRGSSSSGCSGSSSRGCRGSSSRGYCERRGGAQERAPATTKGVRAEGWVVRVARDVAMALRSERRLRSRLCGLVCVARLVCLRVRVCACGGGVQRLRRGANTEWCLPSALSSV